VTLDELLAATRADALMTPALETVAAGTPMRAALAQMVQAGVGSLAVVRPGARPPLGRSDLLGLVPVYFALRAFLSAAGGPQAPVESAMFTELVTAGAGEPLRDVLPRMTGNQTWRLVVLDDDGHAVGLLSATDVLRAIGDCLRGERP
jgi:CBS domain-containing protein